MANHATIKGTTINAGDTVKVFYRIIEKETTAGKTKKEVKETTRERFQPFEGIVIGIRGKGDNMSFIVRRIGVGNIGIERIFPAVSPWINKIVITKKGHARRAKLNFLRGAKKKNRLKSEVVTEEVVSKKDLKAVTNQEKPKD